MPGLRFANRPFAETSNDRSPCSTCRSDPDPDAHRQARRPARTQASRCRPRTRFAHRHRGGRRGEAGPERHRALLRAGRALRGRGRLHRAGAQRLDRHPHGDGVAGCRAAGRSRSGSRCRWWPVPPRGSRSPPARRRSPPGSGSGSRPPPTRARATGATTRWPGPRARPGSRRCGAMACSPPSAPARRSSRRRRPRAAT